ncbi:MAG: Maebl [Bacteroidetes bacterium GWF2_38_335]|nr:MAG: Maebl [Bacteroidetes bacterium GWF2_38_335]OFY80954.1 MAG: Maebl [Bacteroidetes bacterium RIFOXYA12_FULL_38_20]HBS85109.1 Maebl [Bacteroidales bacterium]
MQEKNDLRLAVLIDADNIPYSNIKGMLDEIAKLGVPSIKRIYGDWTKPTISGWKQSLLEHAITPVQQYSYTSGKNATDSAMIIDAMDILHLQKVDGFCLVSSDSDFTRLATRLRESGMLVIGIGEKKTPNPFIVACDKFIYIEILERAKTSSIKKDKTKTSKSEQVAAPKEHKPRVERVNNNIIHLLKKTVEDLGNESGWASMAEVGGLIIKKKPDFDPRNYGFMKLTPLIKSLSEHFEIDEKEVEKSHIKHIYVRIRK